MNSRNYLLLTIAVALGFSIWYMRYLQQKTPSIAAQQEPGTLIVGTNAEYPPFTFVNENDAIVGFDIDIVQEVAKRLAKPIEIKNMSFDALLPQIQLGTIQLIAAGTTPTEERAERVFFTKPYFSGDPLLMITLKSKPSIKSIEDLDNKNVVVNEGFTADMYLSKLEGPNLIRLATISDGFLALNSGRADVFVAAQSAVKSLLDKEKENFNTTSIKGTEEQYALAISKQYPALLSKVQAILDDMQKDGTIKKLKKKWNL